MNKIDEIGRLMALNSHFYDQWARKNGINYNILAVFYGVFNYENCTQKDICEHWCLAKQTVFSVCQELAKQDLLEFIPNPQDKRSKILRLTKQGQALAVPIVERLAKIEQAIMGEFGESKMDTFIQYLQELNAIITKQTQEN